MSELCRFASGEVGWGRGVCWNAASGYLAMSQHHALVLIRSNCSDICISDATSLVAEARTVLLRSEYSNGGVFGIICIYIYIYLYIYIYIDLPQLGLPCML